MNNFNGMPISAKDARAAGLAKYFTGKECSRGHITTRSSHNYSCDDCSRISAEKYRKKNIESMRAYSRINSASEKNRERRAQRRMSPQYRAREGELARIRRKPNYTPEKQKFSVPHCTPEEDRKKVYARLYYHANKEKIRSQYSSRDRKERRRDYIREWAKDYRETENGRAISFMRKCISRCMSNKIDRTEFTLGYKKEDLVAHMESLFKDGMSWGNHGEWHIDHIISIKTMLDQGVTCPKTINALENLQPLWARDNLSKGDRPEKFND